MAGGGRGRRVVLFDNMNYYVQNTRNAFYTYTDWEYFKDVYNSFRENDDWIVTGIEEHVYAKLLCKKFCINLIYDIFTYIFTK